MHDLHRIFARVLLILGLVCSPMSWPGLLGSTLAGPPARSVAENADPPAFLALDLVQSTNGSTWDPVTGDLSSGYSMALCPTTEYHYLDTGNVSTNNKLLSDLSLGAHTITATATDSGGLTGSDQITITVMGAGGNLPPIVSAGPDQAIDLFEVAILDGTVTDDGLPNPPGVLTTTWRQVSGPGTVTFADAAAEDTTASFSAGGEYALELTADDGELWASDQLTVTVNSGAIIRVPEDQPTIQEGIDAAQDGDMVLVSPGTYHERLTLAGKTIILASRYYATQNPDLIDQTIIDGGGSTVIVVGASVGPETTITGFTIRNGDDGISAFAQLNILDNHFVGNRDAIDYESGGGICRNNVFDGNQDDAVDLDGASQVIIENNLIRNCIDDGIEIRLHDYQGPTLNIIIRGNHIFGSGEDGIQLIDYSGLSDRYFLIERNLIEATAMAGLGLMDKGDTVEDYRGASIPEPIHLFNNTFIGNDHGLTGGDNLVALNNLFIGSTTVGLKRVDGGSIAAYNLFWSNGRDYRNSNIDPMTTLYADPLLDAEHHLLPGSPAIDTGTAHFDWEGETVLDLPSSAYNGAAPDLGRFEREPENTPPVVTITSPVEGATFMEGEAITFSGDAADAEDGDVSDSLSWTSSIDGPIGNGESVLRSGKFGFSLDPGSVPEGFWSYWDTKGVYEGAPEWRGYMWEIINGQAPMFYFKVVGSGATQAFSLVDGLLWGYYGIEAHLRVNGDYPTGAYLFEGLIEDIYGGQSPISVSMTFGREYPELLALDLAQSTDMISWDPVSGDLVGGWTMSLGPVAEYYYLDVASANTNHDLAPGYYPFILDADSVPAGFYEYWDAEGVNSSASGDAAQMWQIITGHDPMFYLRVGESGDSLSYMLIDGYEKLTGGGDTHLKVNGDYPFGTYAFDGYIEDGCANRTPVSVGMTFLRGAVKTIALTPDPHVLVAGQTVTYTVTASDAFGNHWDATAEATFAIETTSGGSWADNAYSGEVAGTWTVTATVDSLTDTALLVVDHAAAKAVSLTPDTYTLTAGQSVTYTVAATDTFSNGWDATPEAAFTIEAGAGGSWADNVYTGAVSGTWTVTATVDSVTDTASLTVERAAAVEVVLSPNPYTLVAGEVVTYTVAAHDGHGNDWNATAAAVFAIETGAGGTWLANTYTSANSGPWIVTATVGPLEGTASLIVDHAAAATLSLSPDAYTLMAGQTVTYTVAASDVFGNSWDATAEALYTIEPGAAGSWVENTYTSESEGTWTVTAAVDSATATATLEVLPWPYRLYLPMAARHYP